MGVSEFHILEVQLIGLICRDSINTTIHKHQFGPILTHNVLIDLVLPIEKQDPLHALSSF